MDQDFYRGFSDATGLAYFDAAEAWGDMYSRLKMDAHQVRVAELGCYDEGLIWGAKWKTQHSQALVPFDKEEDWLRWPDGLQNY